MVKSSASGDSSPRVCSATRPTCGSTALNISANTPSDSFDILEVSSQSCSHTILYLSDTAWPGPFTHYSGSDGVVHSLVNPKAT